ncbi:MAG: glycosyltransferase [Pelosinus sp.]|nr:glycosyltransferase [Pelosinus sp.]
MKNVLIISYHYPPVNNIAARRYGYMVKQLEKCGWTPWIITTNSVGALPDSLPQNRVIRIGEHFQTSENIDKCKISKTANEMSGWPRLVHAMLSTCNFRLRIIDRYIFIWYKDVWENYKKIQQVLPKIDLVVATFDPASALWLGRKFAKLYDVPWIADYRDLAALHPLNRSNFAKFVDVQIEKRLLSSVSRLVTVSESLAGMLSSAYQKKCDVIYNGWDSREWPQDSKYLPTAQIPKSVYIYYAGRFYDHQMESVKILLLALKQVGKVKLVIRSLGPVFLENKITELIDVLDVHSLVVMLPSCDPQTVYYEAQHSMANVIVEDLATDDEWSKGTLTGKLFTLLPLQSPLICIARPDSDMKIILERTNKGSLVSSVEELVRCLEQILSATGFKPVETAINEFSRRAQAEKMAAVFDEVMESRHLK